MAWFSKNEDNRKEKFKNLCQVNDLQFLDKDEFGTRAYLRGFELFRVSNGAIRNLAQRKSASLDEEISIFDFKYVIYTGKTAHLVDQTVFFVNSKHLSLPEFHLRPEHFGHKISAFFGWDDIDFEAYPAFSDNYHLTGHDPDFIRHHFDENILRFFSKTSGWTVEAANYYLLFYGAGSLVPDNILIDFYRVGSGVYELFKSKD